MGNTLGGKKSAKIMKIDGETIKFKTPIKVGDVLKDYPGHVVLDSRTVKHYGVRAKPLDPISFLEPKRLYFLVELPKFPDHQHRTPRRVRSAIHMSAKDRLESLLLSKRSVSDLSIMGPATTIEVESPGVSSSTSLRVKMRMPKAEVERLMSQSKNREEVAEKIMRFYESNKIDQKGNNFHGIGDDKFSLKRKEVASENGLFDDQSFDRSRAGYKKKVGFTAIHEGEVALAIAAS